MCKRLARRLRALGLPDLVAYRARLEMEPEEWARLEALCRIPISRFYRDRRVFDALRDRVLPALAGASVTRPDRLVRAWCVGCASGEEAYTLRLIWDFSLARHFPAVQFTILGTDADEVMLARAEAACYGRSSLKDAPAPWIERAFRVCDARLCLRSAFKRDVTFRRQDVRRARPPGPFDLILCRNLAFTYFAPQVQRSVQSALEDRLDPGGVLVIGTRERLPPGTAGLLPSDSRLPIYRKLCAQG